MPRFLLQTWRGDLLLILLMAVPAVGFAAAPTKQYSFDAVSYARQVEQFAATHRLAWLFHPHHLLFNGADTLWWRLARTLLHVPRPLEAQLLLNALAGGASVALCYVLVRQATGCRSLAL